MNSFQQGQTKACGCAAGAACGCDARAKGVANDVAPGAQTQVELDGLASPKSIHRSADGVGGMRDSNGVAADADAAVDRAGRSSGVPLPSVLRTQFEGSLGADLSSVRVHTGTESVEAASAVGARAYTYGQDIHFNAGMYDPTSSRGQHLLAHEVAHTVQQGGGAPTRQNQLEVSTPQDQAELEADRAADAMVAGAPASVTMAGGVARKVIQREGEGEGGGGGSWLPPAAFGMGNKQPDMTPLDWTPEVKPTISDESSAPPLRTLPLGAAPPAPVPLQKHKAAANPCPNCHTPSSGGNDFSFFDQFEKEELDKARNSAWGSYQGAALDAVGSYNTAVPLITNYQVAAKDPALQDVDKFSPPGADENLFTAANNQKVGPADTKVNDIFTKQKVGSASVPGSSLDIGKKGDKAAEDIKNKKDEGVRAAKAQVDHSESSVKIAFGQITVVQGHIKEKSELLMARIGEVHKVEAEEKANEAKEKVDTIEEDKAAAKEKLKAVTGIMEGVAGILKGAGEMGENPVGGTGEILEGSAKFVDVIGEQVINAKYEDKLKAAKDAYNVAKAKIFKVARSVAESYLAAAETALDTAMNEYTLVFLEALKQALRDRRAAYQALSSAVGNAAKAHGADSATANKMAAAVAAVPVIEAVLGRLRAVPEALHAPAGSYNAQVGYHMAKYANDSSLVPFIGSLNDIAGYSEEYHLKAHLWEKRLASVQAMITKLGNG